MTTKDRTEPYPEKQRKKSSVKGHRDNTGQSREESIQEHMLVILQQKTQKLQMR